MTPLANSSDDDGAKAAHDGAGAPPPATLDASTDAADIRSAASSTDVSALVGREPGSLEPPGSSGSSGAPGPVGRGADGAARRRTVSLTAVAEAAGVSRTTVSNAYLRPDQLTPAVRDRVLETARELGYPGPDRHQRPPRARRAGTVGLLLTERLDATFRDPATVQFLEGVGQGCQAASRSLLLVPTGHRRPASTMAGPGTVTQAAVDGFIAYSVPPGDVHLSAALARSVPTVVVDSPSGLAGVPFVGIDDRAAMAELTEHVLALGHRRIGVLCSSLEEDETVGGASSARASSEGDGGSAADELVGGSDIVGSRLAGVFETLIGYYAERPQMQMAVLGSSSFDTGVRGTAELLQRQPDLTAIIALSDVMALGALSELARQGRRVPQDVTVTGFDDVPEAEAAGLTTVRQPTVEKGRLAVELLLGVRGGTTTTHVLPTELVVRTSSGPPPTA